MKKVMAVMFAFALSFGVINAYADGCATKKSCDYSSKKSCDYSKKADKEAACADKSAKDCAKECADKSKKECGKDS